MIPRELRIQPPALLGVRHSVIRTPEAIVRFLKNTEQEGLAVTVSKKTAKKAVDRHRIKRRFAAVVQVDLLDKTQVYISVSPAGKILRGEALKAWYNALKHRILETTI